MSPTSPSSSVSERQRSSSPTDQFVAIKPEPPLSAEGIQSPPYSPGSLNLQGLPLSHIPYSPSSPVLQPLLLATSPHSPPLTYTPPPYVPVDDLISSSEEIDLPETQKKVEEAPPNSLDPLSEFESDRVVPMAKTLNFNEMVQSYAEQNHYYNEEGARKRGVDIINWANDILYGARGSPTAKNNVKKIQETVKIEPIKGENDFQMAMMNILVNETRMVRKPDAMDKKAVEPSDFVTDPRPFKDDYLDRRTKAHFYPECVPQTKASAKTFEQEFQSFPKIAYPLPDVVWGISEHLLIATQKHIKDVLEHCDVPQLTRQLYLPFLAGEFKAAERVILEAIIQTMRDGAAMVWNMHQWNRAAVGQTIPTPRFDVLPQVKATDTSKPDADSACFTVVIDPYYTSIHVNWREEWSNGANWFHTSLLGRYELQAGFDYSTELFQTHLNNIFDWGCLVRAPAIFKHAKGIAERRMKGKTLDFPLPEPKRQKISPAEG